MARSKTPEEQEEEDRFLVGGSDPVELDGSDLTELANLGGAESVDTADIIAAERRERLTRDLDPQTAASFTDEELAEIDAEAEKKAFDAKRKKALEEIRALAEMTHRVSHGLVPPEVLRDDATRQRMAQKVKIRVNLPVGGGALGFRVDGRLFREGEVTTVTRSVYESLLEMHYRIHKAELEFSSLDQSFRNGTSVPQRMTRAPPPFEVIE